MKQPHFKHIKTFFAASYMAIALCAHPALANDSTLFQYQNTPISPLCLLALDPVEEADTLPRHTDLKTCAQNPDITVINLKTAAAGKVELNYRYKEDEDEGELTSLYRIAGVNNNTYVIERVDFTGGSGAFSNLSLYTINGDTLTLINSIAGGDRCNGGVTNTRVENGTVLFDTHITPFDFLDLAFGADAPALEAYEDLEASASSCFATATYAYNFIDQITPQSITFNPDAGIDQSGWSENYTHQVCFNNLFRTEVDAGNTQFSINQFKDFMGRFKDKCL